jgi:hypothetical protein
MGAAREHGIVDALNQAGIQAIAVTAYQGGGAAIRVPQRWRRLDPDTGRYLTARRRSTAPTPVSAGRRAGQRAAEELVDPAQDPLLPEPGPELVAAVQTLMIANV